MSTYTTAPEVATEAKLQKARAWLEALSDMRDDVEEQQMLFGSPDAYEMAYADAFDDFMFLYES